MVTSHHARRLQDVLLIFRVSGTRPSEYRDGHKARWSQSEVLVYFGGGCAARSYCALRDRWKNLRDLFSSWKRLKKHCSY